jgi:hypothetical protein
MNAAIGRFLTWALPLVDDGDRQVFALGLLIAATRIRSGALTERGLGDVAAWVLSEENCSRRPSGGLEPPPPFGLWHGFWSLLATELIDKAAMIRTKTVRDDLELLGQFVRGTI